MCWEVFPEPTSNFWTLAGWPAIQGQFNSDLPRAQHQISQVRALSHQNCPLPPGASPKPRLSPAIDRNLQCPPPGVGVMCKSGSPKSEVTSFTYLGYLFIIKDTAQEQLNARDAEGKVWGKGAERPCCLSTLLSLKSPAYQLRSSPNPIFFLFLEVSLHRCDWLNHWPLVIELNLHPLPAPTPFLLGDGSKSSNHLIKIGSPILMWRPKVTSLT